MGDVTLGGHADEGFEMTLVGVDSAVGEEADEVEGSSLLGGEVVGAYEGGVGVEGAVEDRGVDAGHVHADDAAGAKVEMADFAVAHLAVGEADEVLARRAGGCWGTRGGACRRWVCGLERWRCRGSRGGNPSRRGW